MRFACEVGKLAHPVVGASSRNLVALEYVSFVGAVPCHILRRLHIKAGFQLSKPIIHIIAAVIENILKGGVSLIAVTGEKATEASDANVQVLDKLTEIGIEIVTINQGAGKLNLLIGVPDERYEDAIRAIYSCRQSIS